MKRHPATALVAAFLAVAPPASASLLGPFTDLVVFGDSLSDPGNAFVASGRTVPDPLFYPEGQFTDGDTWATQLGADLASGTNFAFGGANAVTNADASLDFAAQRGLLALAAPNLGPRPLTAVFLGGNDLRAASTPAEGAAIIAAATGAIADGIADLIGGGLDDVLVLGLPNLGRLPDIAGTPAAGLATALTVAFNAALETAIAPLRSRANVQYFDTFAAFEAIFADPAAYGIFNTTDACLDSFPSCGPDTASGHVFYDDLHPTERVHEIFASGIAAQLVPIPLPASLPLAAAGLALLAAAGFRSRRSAASRNRVSASQTVSTRMV